jgi:creatinine amidohydrolase
MFVNGHGGNVPALTDAVQQLVGEEHRAAWAPCGVPGQDAHAGREETSVMLFLQPSAVRLEVAQAGASDDLATLMPALREGGVIAVSPNGVLGDPAGASAEEGRELLARMSATVAEKFWREWPELR